MKHEFAQKAEFIYLKLTDNTTTLIDQIENISKELYAVKSDVKVKMAEYLQESKLYGQELSRT